MPSKNFRPAGKKRGITGKTRWLRISMSITGGHYRYKRKSL
jgi:hypothetical protein